MVDSGPWIRRGSSIVVLGVADMPRHRAATLDGNEMEEEVPRGLPPGTPVYDVQHGNQVIYINQPSGLDPDRYYVANTANATPLQAIGHRDRHNLNLVGNLFHAGQPINGGLEAVHAIAGPVPAPFISGPGIDGPHLSVMAPAAHANHVYHVNLRKVRPPDPGDPPWMPPTVIQISYQFDGNGHFLRTNPAHPPGFSGGELNAGRVFAAAKVQQFRNTAQGGFIT